MTSKLISMFYPGEDDIEKKGKASPPLTLCDAPRLIRGKADASKPTDTRRAQNPSIQEGSGSASPRSSPQGAQGVRFASAVQEIEPLDSINQTVVPTSQSPITEDDLAPEAKEELRSLAMSLQMSKLQHSRMSNFAFEPMSLPPSRATSREPSPRGSPRPDLTPSGRPSGSSSIQSPPLTPRDSREPPLDASAAAKQENKQEAKPGAITPQTSPPQQFQGRAMSDSISPMASASRPPSSEQISTRPTSVSEESIPEVQHRVPRFMVGPSRESSSGDRSPAPTPKSESPQRQRPSTPTGDQGRKRLGQVDERHPSGKDSKRNSTTPVQALQNAQLLPRFGSSGNEAKRDKKPSIFGGKKDSLAHVHDESSGSLGEKKHHGSMSELKRFFRLGGHKNKRSESPAPTPRKANAKSGSQTPPHQAPVTNVPFADEHGLEAKYGKFGKVLGSGAGGSVRLLKRSSDGVTFAVKQFRDRHSWESEKDYSKKVTAEFCIGSTLHHGNIIETMDIIQENGRWFEVMEYAPYDLFAIVMTGKMSREEVACSFLQIVNGVNYLHSMGLAHRDLKLDNVVVSEHGIMKIIDFGSATVFRYPFETDMVLASGIVGSDPYLAPEVYDEKKYDPTATDVWSLAIIFCCMSLRRFPWKQPRIIDNSYKLFVAPPTPGTPVPDSEPRRASDFRPKDRPVPDVAKDPGKSSEPREPSQPRGGDEKEKSSKQHQQHHHHPPPPPPPHPHHHHHHPPPPTHRSQVEGDQADGALNEQSKASSASSDQPAKVEAIKGPWRLLRILPRETRHIIGRMLMVDPKDRATMEEVMEDQWVVETPVCSQEEQGEVRRAPGHEHTLEAGNAPQPAADK